MNGKRLSNGMAALILLATSAHAAVVQYDFPDINAMISDANPGGWSDTRTISGWSAGYTITDVKLTLNLSGGYNGDLYAYLAHDSGFAVLLNRVGRTGSDPYGYGNTGMWLALRAGKESKS
jgi:hypothetical protein